MPPPNAGPGDGQSSRRFNATTPNVPMTSGVVPQGSSTIYDAFAGDAGKDGPLSANAASFTPGIALGRTALGVRVQPKPIQPPTGVHSEDSKSNTTSPFNVTEAHESDVADSTPPTTGNTVPPTADTITSPGHVQKRTPTPAARYQQLQAPESGEGSSQVANPMTALVPTNQGAVYHAMILAQHAGPMNDFPTGQPLVVHFQYGGGDVTNQISQQAGPINDSSSERRIVRYQPGDDVTNPYGQPAGPTNDFSPENRVVRYQHGGEATHQFGQQVGPVNDFSPERRVVRYRHGGDVTNAYGTITRVSGRNGQMGRQGNRNRQANGQICVRDEDAFNANNTVSVEAILHGIDVRTTIMIRNIPKQVQQHHFKMILDQTSFGKYDFMYLRINFEKAENVGYGFVNFADPLDIVNLVMNLHGQRWSAILRRAGIQLQSRFYDKQVGLSYATVQGKDCLIQKFRNSSVMIEDESYRPKLFIVGRGRLAGQEEEFPGPDNPSKLRRSIANADTRDGGLYPARTGQAMRDAQRSRSSPYDRGTTAAEYEAYMQGLSTGRNILATGRFLTLTAPPQIPGFYRY